jgi:dynein light intermediate chain
MNQEEKREDQRSLIKYALPVTVNTMGKRGKDKKDGKDIATTDVEDILNSILPPREYTKDKQQLYIESVLSTPATETDVIMLQHVALLFK